MCTYNVYAENACGVYTVHTCVGAEVCVLCIWCSCVHVMQWVAWVYSVDGAWAVVCVWIGVNMLCGTCVTCMCMAWVWCVGAV